MRRPIYEMLAEVAGRTSLHMPAAQGKAPFESLSAYAIETTEIPVTDDLYNPSGAILEAETLLARSANAKASFMLSGGSTAGIHTMILYACKRGDSIILPRNVHLSVLSICAIAGIEPVFARPEELPGGYLTTTPEAYGKALRVTPQATAVLALSSDYYGVLSDVPAIAEIVHAQGKLLLCDEAHGAYFNWREDMQNAGQRGADLFVQSAHKTLPALNAAAWLHAMDGVDSHRLRDILRMVQTSSPSFALLQSMDDARAWMDHYGSKACKHLEVAIGAFLKKAYKLGMEDDRGELPSDALRLVLRCQQGGEWMQQRLQDAGFDIEMSDAHRVVCILSLLDGEARLQKLLEALEAITSAGDTAPAIPAPIRFVPETWPVRAMPLHEAAFADMEELEPRKAIGRISGATVGIYPPGTAWLTAGETITEEIVNMIITTPAHRLFGVNSGIRCVK